MPREQAGQAVKAWAHETLCACEITAKISKGVGGREGSGDSVTGALTTGVQFTGSVVDGA